MAGLSSVDIEGETIMQKKKRQVKVSDQKSLLLLRTYLTHPCSWGVIVDTIQDNVHTLPEDTQALYKEKTKKQLRDRLSTKFSKIMTKKLEDIPNLEIREEVLRVKELESRLQQKETGNRHQKGNGSKVSEKSSANASTSREAFTQNLSSSDESAGMSKEMSKKTRALSMSDSDFEEKVPKKKAKKRKGQKKIPLAELVRKNHEEYNNFITKKVPKLLRVLGVSDSDSE